MMWLAFLFFAAFMAAEGLFNKMRTKKRYSSRVVFAMDTVLILLFIAGLFMSWVAIIYAI